MRRASRSLAPLPPGSSHTVQSTYGKPHAKAGRVAVRGGHSVRIVCPTSFQLDRTCFPPISADERRLCCCSSLDSVISNLECRTHQSLRVRLSSWRPRRLRVDSSLASHSEQPALPHSHSRLVRNLRRDPSIQYSLRKHLDTVFEWLERLLHRRNGGRAKDQVRAQLPRRRDL